VRIALVSEWLDAWRGGAETSTLQVLAELLRAGVEVDVYTRSRPSPSPGLRVCHVNGAAASRTRASVTFARRADRLIAEGDYDVVHAVSPCFRADLYQPRGGTIAESIERNLAVLGGDSARALKRMGNALNFKRRRQLATERRLLASGQGPVVIAISDYVARQLQRHYHLPPDRIRRIFNAVEPDRADDQQRRRDRADIRRQYRIRESELLVVLVAHNFRLKGVGPWMEALAELTRRRTLPIRSLVIGKAPAERYRRRAGRLGIGSCLTFTGPTDRVRAFLHAADVLVHPTYYDPCSRVVLEAMTAGLPCVASRWDGASELIQDGVSGYVIEEIDPLAIAARIADLMDRGRRERMSAEAARVGGGISLTGHVRQLLACYDEVAASRRAGAASRR